MTSLIEALGWIRRFRDKITVIKLGGSVGEGEPGVTSGRRRSFVGVVCRRRPQTTGRVERNNGTIRTFMRRFTRLSYAFSMKLENHAAAVALFAAYYNYVRRARYPDNSGKPGMLRPTAVVMAKVVPELWNFDRLYDEVIRYG